jgi:copper(I)-binding protein
MKIFWAIITILFMFVGVDFSGRGVKLEEVWVRAAVEGAPTAVFLKIKNSTGEVDNLLSATSSVADSVTLVETKSNNGVEELGEVKALPVESNQEVVLKPHGLFLELKGLRKALVIGDTIPVTLNFTKAGFIETKAHVEAANATLYDNF